MVAHPQGRRDQTGLSRFAGAKAGLGPRVYVAPRLPGFIATRNQSFTVLAGFTAGFIGQNRFGVKPGQRQASGDMRKIPTIAETFDASGGYTAGFDYLRLILAVSVLSWHTLYASGSNALEDSIRSGPFAFFPDALVPMFFAISGFLVAHSLHKSTLPGYITLRAVRIVPALAVEVTLSAIILGALFTSLPLGSYFRDPDFYAYFLDIIGLVHYKLPGVFDSNVVPHLVNAQLWTVLIEIVCYSMLALFAVFRLLSRRALFTGLVVVLCLATAAWSFAGGDLHDSSNSGRLPTLCFLAAVAVYLYRDSIPCSAAAGYGSLIVSAILLATPAIAFFAPFPLAYATIWLGLRQPRRLPFGDLSYGIYLFHFPIEQTIMHLRPGITWWQLVLVALPATTAVAWLSWTFVENPVLSRKRSVVQFVNRACGELAEWLRGFVSLIGSHARVQ